MFSYDNSKANNEDSILISSYQNFNVIYLFFCCVHEKSILYTDKRFFGDKKSFKNILK